MTKPSLAFIGAGNMAAALVHGLVKDGYPAERIIASDPDDTKLQALRRYNHVQTAAGNTDACRSADVVVLAVKPQILRQVAEDLAPAIRDRRPLVVSIAAGVKVSTLQRWLGDDDIPVVRTMPNTPAMVQTGATALYASAGVSDAQRNHAEMLMRAVGLTLWLEDEAHMDAVTALSGSGPAYFFLVMDAMAEAAERLGLTAESAQLLTLQTALGAARMAMESADSPATLRARVTSPGGTTEQAIATFEEGGLRDLFRSALQAARDRSVELSQVLDAD
jgi:pyrroline-5-carboxylate reductase